jgi:hypothetical protein
MRSSFFVCLSVLLLMGSGAHADETFTYTSPTYTTNGNPSLFGTSLTVTVTLSCSGPCADGTYSATQLTSLTMTSGTLSFTVPGKDISGDEIITLTNGQVSSWNFAETSDNLQSYGGVYANGATRSLAIDINSCGRKAALTSQASKDHFLRCLAMVGFSLEQLVLPRRFPGLVSCLS